MANRFLETNYYKSPFVRKLKGSLKSLYSYIICDCTASGIWSLDLEVASMYIGFSVSMEEYSEEFISKGKAVDIGGGKYFFPDFIEHQYPKGLSLENKAHKNIIFELQKLDLLDDNLRLRVGKGQAPSKDLPSSFEAPSKTLQSPPITPYGNGNGKGYGNGKGNGNTGEAPSKPLPSSFQGPSKPLIPEMCDVWYTTFPNYTRHRDHDFPAMKEILDFISAQHGVTDIENTDVQLKILNTLQSVADKVSGNKFWKTKPLKSVAGHIQEFYNQLKTPPEDGKGRKEKQPTSNGSTREQLNEQFNKRYGKG